jgi:hypothetical protein
MQITANKFGVRANSGYLNLIVVALLRCSSSSAQSLVCFASQRSHFIRIALYKFAVRVRRNRVLNVTDAINKTPYSSGVHSILSCKVSKRSTLCA